MLVAGATDLLLDELLLSFDDSFGLSLLDEDSFSLSRLLLLLELLLFDVFDDEIEGLDLDEDFESDFDLDFSFSFSLLLSELLLLPDEDS